MISYSEAKRYPLKYKVPILVAGGGPAGISAAFSASRLGISALIVEQFNCLGGIATSGGHNHICLFSTWGESKRIVGGVLWEVVNRVSKAGYGIVDNCSSDFEIEGMKFILEQMAEETGTRLLYHTIVLDTIVDAGHVRGVLIGGKSGIEVILADIIIDCTGDGDVAAHAGCRYEIGDEKTGLCQAATLMFTIGGVDWEKVKIWRENYRMESVWLEAQKRGNMRPFQTQIMGWWWTPTRPDMVGVNFTHVLNVNALDQEDLTRATIEARKQVFESISVFKKYVPGMENCYLVSTPPSIGIRESRRIKGLYTLTREDVVSMAQFEDSIGYGSFFIDIHGTKGPGMDEKTWRPQKGFKYQIPYRIIVPQDTENLLVAGRCASCTHEALGSLRVMPQCGVMGQAAGTAAILSLKSGKSIKEIDVSILQRMLRDQGCIISEEDIEKVNVDS